MILYGHEMSAMKRAVLSAAEASSRWDADLLLNLAFLLLLLFLDLCGVELCFNIGVTENHGWSGMGVVY